MHVSETVGVASRPMVGGLGLTFGDEDLPDGGESGALDDAAILQGVFVPALPASEDASLPGLFEALEPEEFGPRLPANLLRNGLQHARHLSKRKSSIVRN